MAAKDIGDKVQVVIDGARRTFGQLLNPFLTSLLSDSKQARVVAKDIGDKVQVVIDGAGGLPGHWVKLSNICTFRRQGSKSCSTGNQIGYTTGCQRHR